MARYDKRAKPVITVGWVTAFVLVVIAVFSVKRFNYSVPQHAAWLRDTPIAHRGLHNSRFDENSLGAFTNAISGGYGIELDVRLTKDGVPVVIHDDNLDRLFGVDNSVSKIPLADLKELKLPKSGEAVPTFAEAMAHIGGQVPVLIEVKDFGLPGKLEAKVLDILEGYEGEYALQSFNPLVCRWLRKRDAKLTVGLLLDDVPFPKSRYLNNLKDNVFSAIGSPGFIAYNYSVVNDEVVKGYRASDVTVLGYGLHDDALAGKEYKSYVDNIIFELTLDKR